MCRFESAKIFKHCLDNFVLYGFEKWIEKTVILW